MISFVADESFIVSFLKNFRQKRLKIPLIIELSSLSFKCLPKNPQNPGKHEKFLKKFGLKTLKFRLKFGFTKTMLGIFHQCTGRQLFSWKFVFKPRYQTLCSLHLYSWWEENVKLHITMTFLVEHVHFSPMSIIFSPPCMRKKMTRRKC